MRSLLLLVFLTSLDHKGPFLRPSNLAGFSVGQMVTHSQVGAALRCFVFSESRQVRPLILPLRCFLLQRLLSNEEEKNRAIIQEVCFMVSFSRD